MPKNKEALIRYRVINRCIREKGSVTIKEMIIACEKALDISPISKRTIEGDINAMRYDNGLGYHAPIKSDSTKNAYYYDDPGYSIDNIPLNEEEMESLVFAAKLLEQFQNIEIFKTFNGSVQKLVNALNIYRYSEKTTKRNFIEFENVAISKGTEHLQDLINVIKDKKVLRIEYMPFKLKKSKSHIIHPYHLKEYRNRWFLIGFDENQSGIRTFGLERIMGITLKPDVKFIDKGFDPKEYYRDIIGISVLKMKPVQVEIAFSELQAKYILTQPVHHSQQFVKNIGDRKIFRFLLVPNYEFYSTVLGWGEEVEILSPKRIRRQYSQYVEKLYYKYQL